MSIAQVCGRHDDARLLRLALLDEIRKLASFDAFAWLLTDPATEVGTGPIADVPGLDQLPRLIRLKYSTVVNRWTDQAGPVSRLWDTTRGRLDESLLWRECLADFGVTDVASIVFRDRAGCWSFLDLWRLGGVFTDAEAAAIARSVEVMTAALRRCVARSLERPVSDRTIRWSGPLVLLLSSDLEVRAQTPETDRLLKILVPRDDDRPPVPAGAYNVGAQLLAMEKMVDDHPPVARVHIGDGDWVTLRAARIDDGIAVTIEACSSAERLDLFVRAADLTRREAELVRLLAAGGDTATLADQMYLSPHTVQDHLKSIFAKTGATSRRELLTRATGR